MSKESFSVKTNINDNYFLIPTSNKNNLIHLLIIQTLDGEKKADFVVVESRVPSRGNCYKPRFLDCDSFNFKSSFT